MVEKVDDVTLQEFVTYLQIRGYSKQYIKEMVNMFKRLAINDPTIHRCKSSHHKANTVLRHIKSYKSYYRPTLFFATPT